MTDSALDDVLELYRWRFGVEDPALLDWTGSMRVRPRITDDPVRDERPDAPARNTVVFGPAGDRLSHPDRSMHLVVLDDGPSAASYAEARRVARDAVVVWSADGAVSVEWLRDVQPTRPVVSVIVVAGGAPELLDGCLRSLAATTPVTPAIEVVLVDRGPAGAEAGPVTGAGARRLALRHVSAAPARGAIGAANLGAELARGTILVVLDESTRVLPGWLRPLYRTLARDSGVGVVGPKLLAEDGTVAAAGGVLFSDASVAGFDEGSEEPEAPRLASERDVPWVPGALLATRRGLLRGLGGIDPLVGEARGDVDYCLRVEAAGRRVVYQPQAVAATLAPVRAEAPWESGDRFRRRWTARLATCPDRPHRLDAAAWDRLRGTA